MVHGFRFKAILEPHTLNREPQATKPYHNQRPITINLVKS
jgi:hypothetical protein